MVLVLLFVFCLFIIFFIVAVCLFAYIFFLAIGKCMNRPQRPLNQLYSKSSKMLKNNVKQGR